MLPRLDRLLSYDQWANGEALASLRAADKPPARALSVLGHIVGAEELWLGRLRQDGTAGAVWPDLSLEECGLRLEQLRLEWRHYLQPLTAVGLSRSIGYTNSKGERWQNTVEDILLHVVIHSVYHRGQIARDLRAEGYVPAYTDFIHSVRQRLLE